LPYLVQRDDLAVRLLDLLQLGEEVPEAGLGDHIVGGKDAHAVELWRRLAVGGQMAPDDLVLLEATWITVDQTSALSYGKSLRMCVGYCVLPLQTGFHALSTLCGRRVLTHLRNVSATALSRSGRHSHCNSSGRVVVVIDRRLPLPTKVRRIRVSVGAREQPN